MKINCLVSKEKELLKFLSKDDDVKVVNEE
jgi:hypothetical protein